MFTYCRWRWWKASPAYGNQRTTGWTIRPRFGLVLDTVDSGVCFQFVRIRRSTSNQDALCDAQCLSQLLPFTRGKVHHGSDVPALGLRFPHVGRSSGMNCYNQNAVSQCFGFLVSQGVSLTMGATGIFGPEIWQYTILGVKPCLIFEITLYVSAMITSHPIIIHNIYK